jgi:hypothetical protein
MRPLVARLDAGAEAAVVEKISLKCFRERTKAFALLVLLPIPYLLSAALLCAAWHTQLSKGATGGDWFDWCMPDGMLFNFLLSVLLLIAVLSLIPFLVCLRKDWQSYSASRSPRGLS